MACRSSVEPHLAYNNALSA